MSTFSKKITLIGIDPKYMDFTTEHMVSQGLTFEKVSAGVLAQKQALIDLGYDTSLIWVDLGETAVEVISENLKANQYDGILIGAGTIL